MAQAEVPPPPEADGYRLAFASPFDLRAIHRLERIVFPGEAYGYLDLLMLLLAPGMVNLKIVAPDSTLVGFVSGGRLFRVGRTWIMTIGVHPAHQRRGLGRWLLEACESLLPDRTIYLTVRTDNHRAITLYRLNGYREVGIKPGYYGNGQPGIEMRKDRPAGAG